MSHSSGIEARNLMSSARPACEDKGLKTELFIVSGQNVSYFIFKYRRVIKVLEVEIIRHVGEVGAVAEVSADHHHTADTQHRRRATCAGHIR